MQTSSETTSIVEVVTAQEDGISLRELTRSDSNHDGNSNEDHDSNSNTTLPPTDGGRQAWQFLAAATMLEALIWGMGNSYGAFQDYHISSPQSPLYHSPSAVSSAVGTLISAGQYFAPFLFSGLLNTYPHRIRIFSIISLLISCLGLIGASIHSTPTSIIGLQGFLSGWAGGAFYLPAIVWLPQWFDEKRGLATGIMFLGSGVGGVIWPFIFSTLLNKVGFSWTLRVLCLIQLIVGGITLIFLQPRIPIINPNPNPNQIRTRRQSSSFAAEPKTWKNGYLFTLTRTNRRRLLGSINPLNHRQGLKSVLPDHNSALNSKMGAISILLQFLHAAAFKSISYYISPYASSLGLSSIISTSVLASLNATSAISYVLTGKLCDVFPHGFLILSINTVATILVGILFGLANSFTSLLAFSLLYGFFNGGFSTTLSPLSRQLARSNHSNDSSSIFLEYLAWRGAGGLVGPLISSAIYHPSNTTNTSINKTIWSAKAHYGSHGIGPVVVFTTVTSGVVALLSIFTINFRSRPAASHNLNL